MENAKFVTEFSNGSGAKTVITLDLHLYERAMQIVQSDVIMKEKIILRLGDLHIVFAHIRSIGHFTQSGIDHVWGKANLFGSQKV